MAKLPTRPSIADMLENASHALDELIRDARLDNRVRHDLRHGDLEERAQAIAASIVAPFRGQSASSVAPIAGGMQGNKAWAAW